MGVVQRCKAVWNHLDWYGNVLSEPLVVEGTEILRANAPDPQYQMPIMKGYFNVRCQYNEQTAQIDDNTRMILGSSCYVVTGFSDFNTEFTGDYDSVRMIEFTIRRDEVNRTIDDMENHVAGGLAFDWDVVVSGPLNVAVDGTVKMEANSTRCNEYVVSSDEHPINYVWTSSDESIATVDENGVVTGVSDGTCEITVTLEQNPKYSRTVQMDVTAEEAGLAWETTPPDEITAYQCAVLTVTKEAKWSFAGADPAAYTATASETSATVLCWRGSIAPLRVTAEADGESVSCEIRLVGL
jgi:hypothetical protein